MKVLYLIGEPGIGKTSAMRELTDRLGPSVEMTKPFAHRMGDLWAEMGRRRGTFSGTDSLSMSVQPLAIEWLRSRPAPLVLGEGDRLGNASFFDQVSTFADLRIVGLVGAPGVAARRRELRGSEQDPQWLRGRMSKVERLLPRAIRIIDSTQLSPREVADELSKEVSR